MQDASLFVCLISMIYITSWSQLQVFTFHILYFCPKKKKKNAIQTISTPQMKNHHEIHM